MIRFGIKMLNLKTHTGDAMEKRTITEILEEMERIESIEIGQELIDFLTDYFKADIELGL
jgi:translation elongation factor EF-1beta